MKIFLLLILGVSYILTQNAENRRFAGNVYKEMLKGYPNNFLVCPISVKLVLALVRLGAGGRTAQELSKGLQLPENSQSIQKYLKQFLSQLQGNKQFELISANKIYVSNDFQINDFYKRTAANIFNAEIQNINFSNSQRAAKAINKWIEERTNKKIQNMVNEGNLGTDTVLILINAIYFHGTWLHKFNRRLTVKRNFLLNRKTTVSTDMMETTSSFSVFENFKLSATFLEMPYKGNVTLTLVLPNDVEGLSELETSIDDVLAPPPYFTSAVHVIIPKFKIDTNIDFTPILTAMGIKDAFGANANFSGISAQPLAISNVLQKSFIEVDEEGTTAAATTTVRLKFKTALRAKPFIADHPFLFYLKLRTEIMFVGRYTGRK